MKSLVEVRDFGNIDFLSGLKRITLRDALGEVLLDCSHLGLGGFVDLLLLAGQVGTLLCFLLLSLRLGTTFVKFGLNVGYALLHIYMKK